MNITFKNLIAILWANLWKILIAALATGAIALALTRVFTEPQYTATASMYVNNKIEGLSVSGITQQDITASQSLVNIYIVIIKSDAVLNQVAGLVEEKYHDRDLSAVKIRSMLKAGSIDATEAFSISITDTDPDVAKSIVDTIIAVAPAEIQRIIKASTVEVIDQAALPQKPHWPIVLNTIIGFALGVLFMALYYWIFVLTDKTVYSEKELIENFKIPIIGSIPDINMFDKSYEWSQGK